MTFKLATSGGVGEQIKKYLDVTIKGGPASSVTFVLPNDEAANTFAQQIKDSAKAIALAPLNRFGIGGERPHIDFPPIESVSYEQSGGVSGSAWRRTAPAATATARSIGASRSGSSAT